MLHDLSNIDISIMFIRLNKQKVYSNMQNEKPVLYNYVTNILLDRVFSKKLISPDNIQLVASKRETNRFLNENFKNYLKKDNHRLEVIIKTPAEEKSLQAIDFISWSAFRKYEYNDESYYNIFKKKVIEDNILFGV